MGTMEKTLSIKVTPNYSVTSIYLEPMENTLSIKVTPNNKVTSFTWDPRKSPCPLK